MKKTMLIIVMVSLLSLALMACGGGDTPPDVGKEYSFEIVSEENLTYANVQRLGVKVVLEENYTQDELKEIAEQVVKNVTNGRLLNAVAISIYNQGDDLDGPSTVAEVDWAPEGDWLKADEVSAGDYTKHEYKYDFK